MYQNRSTLFFLCLMIHQTTSTSYLAYFCNTTMFDNIVFQTNLNTLFRALSSNATNNPSGYYRTTTGNPPNETIYGHYLCRGDQSTTSCHDCVTTATTTGLPKGCSNQKVAIIWYDECLVRYSNQSFFDKMDERPLIVYWNKGDIVDNKTRFMESVTNMISNVIAVNAAEGGSFKKYATDFVNYSVLQPIYGLGQCTPDLSPNDCYQCINSSVKSFHQKPGNRVLARSCVVRYEIHTFFNLSNMPQPPQPSPLPSPTGVGKNKVSTKLIVSIIAALLAILLATLFLVCICLLRKKARKIDVTIATQISNEEFTAESLQYDLATLLRATNNFADENKLGEGGFGGVYKGTLSNGQLIAVKRLSVSSSQGIREFKTEALLVAKLQHRNLVRLLGFCYTGQEKLIVYEYVANKSLDNFIFDLENRQLLSWQKRYNIIRGIARGLLYLHHDSQLIIIHRDLKASNILLDEEMNPKISDFGTSRIFGVDQSQSNYTNRVAGTYGYMAPEYALHGQFSIKSDVYSFGVLVLEIISGKRNCVLNNLRSDNAEDLLRLAWRQWEARTPLECVDPTIRESCSNDSEVMRCIQLGLLCVQESVEDRPTMANVVLTLDSYSVTLPLPEQPDLFSRTRDTFSKEVGTDHSSIKSTPLSVNDVSITEPEAR